MSKKSGFYISKLVLQGSVKEDAVIDFAPGFNVVSGASNTGKTFILQCIDYLFGAGSNPKEIPEANGYRYIFLEIKLYTGETFTLMRDLQESSKTYRVDGTVEQFWDLKETSAYEILNSTNRSTKDSQPLSQFLLYLCGFEGNEVVKKNSENKKRKLSFRDISHLSVVDEETIIEENSPVFNSTNTNETAEGAVFQLLITGEDSGELIETGDVTKRRNGVIAQIELMKEMSKDVAEKIAMHKERQTDVDISIEEDISKINDQYIEIQEALKHKTELRQKVWNELDQSKMKFQSLSELLIRFNILKSQYGVDLERLNFLDEGEYLLSQLNSNKCTCPVCNSEMDPEVGISKDFRNSIAAEADKIKSNLNELSKTILANEEEQERLRKVIEHKSEQYSACEQEITENLEPHKVSMQLKLQGLVDRQRRILTLNTLRGQAESLSKKEDDLVAQLEQLKKTTGSKGQIDPGKLNKFTETVKSLLVRWKYISANAFVDFNKVWNVLDIEIDGIARAANGKGVRALLHSAFTLGILEHCYSEELPHSRIVILDTPLHSFREKDSGLDDLAVIDRVKNAFFTTLASFPQDVQIIVFENEEPPEEVKSKIKYHYFSGTSEVGRGWFIPQPVSEI